MYGTAQVNKAGPQRVLNERFQCWNVLDLETFERLHRDLCVSESFYV